MKKPDLFLMITDAILAGLFWIITLVCLHGVASGAWWHIGTATACILLIWMFINDIRKECKNVK